MSAQGQIGRGGDERESTVEGPPSESLSEQYSLAKILGIWAAAALSMGLILWVITPFRPGEQSGDSSRVFSTS
jgi:hypothetical protein